MFATCVQCEGFARVSEQGRDRKAVNAFFFLTTMPRENLIATVVLEHPKASVVVTNN